MEDEESVMADAGKKTKREPLEARPQPEVDREALRADIRKRFSKTFEYLAK
jgi:hypothetical protein